MHPYEAWLEPSILKSWKASQSSLNCRHCPLPFQAQVKCCTYHPFIPNYLIGGALKDPQTASRMRRYLSEEPERLNLLGLLAGPQVSPENFGKFAKDLCGLFSAEAFSGGGCSIWQYRPAKCLSYHCGKPNQEAWQAQLESFEWSLAHEVLWRLGFTMDDIKQESEITEQHYHRCWEVAEALSWQARVDACSLTVLETAQDE